MGHLKQSTIKISIVLNYNIDLQKPLDSFIDETSCFKRLSDSRFIKRVEKVYFLEASLGIPDFEHLAYQVFYDYFEPEIETILQKSISATEQIVLDLSDAKLASKEQNNPNFDVIQNELNEHVEKIYQDYMVDHQLNVRMVMQMDRFSVLGKMMNPYADVVL